MGWVDGLAVYVGITGHTKKLIEAVIESAYGQGDPPPELITAWECNRWNCLPESGGYYDQDYILMIRMSTFSNLYSLMQRWQKMSGKNIHTLSESERKALRRLKDEGFIFQ